LFSECTKKPKEIVIMDHKRTIMVKGVKKINAECNI